MGQSKYSNEHKRDCIVGGTLDFVKNKRRELQVEGYATYDWLNFLNYAKNSDYCDCALRIIDSDNRRYKRILNKIERLVYSGEGVFITLTFTDKVIENTSQDTRRRYVARYLKEQSPCYVANIDFSPTKQREHYHAVVNNTCDLKAWAYGFCFAEKVHKSEKDKNKVARYVSKLTNHALKVKCLNNRLIYSRDV